MTAEAPRTPQDAREALREVYDRLASKVPQLDELRIEARSYGNHLEAARLAGKIEGVKLAMSFVNDEWRILTDAVAGVGGGVRQP